MMRAIYKIRLCTTLILCSISLQVAWVTPKKSLPVFWFMSDWITYHNAVPFNFQCKECYRLTEAQNSQRGCVWDPQTVDLSGPVFAQATLYFGDNNGGADGICLIFAAAPDCGVGGGSIGAGGIPNSVIIEFDTWDNGPGFGDIPDDHVALNINGDMANPLFGPVSLGNIEDGEMHTMSFSYDGAGNFEVVFDGATVLTGNLDFAAIIGSSDAYMGYTGSTGGANNVHIVCPDNVPVPPAEDPDWASYVLEVCEGTVGVPYGVVPSPGHTYEWTLPPGASGPTAGSSINIAWGSTGGEVCVSADNGCGKSDTVCVEVMVTPLPTVTVESIVLCEESFNLEELVLINLQPGEKITYHPSQQAANNGFPEMSPPPVVYFSGTYWIRVEAGNGCVQVLPVDITLENLEIIVEQPAPVCAPGSVELSLVPVIDVNGVPIVYTTFHITAGDAAQGLNPILQTEMNASGTFWVRAESEHGCWDIAAIEIIIQDAPEMWVESPPALCDVTTFDLSTLDIVEMSGLNAPQYTITFHPSNIAAQQGSPVLSSTVVSASGTYWIRMTTAAGCYDVAKVEIKFVEIASAFITGPDTLCPGEPFEVEVTFSGSGPYEFTYSYLGDTVTLSTNENPFIFEIATPNSGWISLLSFKDSTPEDCPQEIGPPQYVEVLPEFRVSAPVMVCEGQQYSVQFQLLEGDEISWVVWGLAGTQQGGVFVSEFLESGTSWTLLTWDGNGCDTLEMTGSINCDCENDAGVIPQDTLYLCPGDTMIFDHTGMVLGPQDTLIWVLFGPGQALPWPWDYSFGSNHIYYPDNPSVILPGIFYRVQGIVGQKDGQGGIDLQDPCLSVTNYYHVFFEWPAQIQSIMSVPGTEFTCQDTVITLDVQFSGSIHAQGASYQWQTQGGQILSDPTASSVQVRGAGTYFIRIQSNLTSCFDTASIILTVSEDVPEVIFIPPDVLTCVNQSVQLDASASSQGPELTFSWTTPDGNFTGGTGTHLPTVDKPGTYILTIIDNVNQCSATGSVVVSENVTPPVAKAGPDVLLDCGEEFPVLDGGGSTGQGILTFAWTTLNGAFAGSANQSLLTITQPGIYWLEVTDPANGCRSADSLAVMTTDELVVSGIYVEHLSCHGDMDGVLGITTVGGGTSPYSMKLGASTQPVPGEWSDLAAGMHTVSVVDAGGCTWDTLIAVKGPAPIQLSLGLDVEVQVGSSHLLVPIVSGGTPPYTFTWFEGGGEVCAFCPNYSTSPTADTEVGLHLMDANGCMAMATVRLTVITVKSVFIPNSFSPNYDGINDLLTIYGGDVVSRVRRLAVYDRWGNAIYEVADLPADGTAGWDGHYKDKLMDPGVYVYVAEIEFTDGEIRIYKGDVNLIR